MFIIFFNIMKKIMSNLNIKTTKEYNNKSQVISEKKIIWKMYIIIMKEQHMNIKKIKVYI